MNYNYKFVLEIVNRRLLLTIVLNPASCAITVAYPFWAAKLGTP